MTGAGTRNGEGVSKAQVAELMSLDLAPGVIAQRLGCSNAYIYKRIQQIKADLGWLGD